jgi:GxxExxY protein
MANDTTTERIIGSAITVHSELGAGCLESTYHACLAFQLRADGLQFGHQVRLPITYRDVTLDAGYRIDFLVENCVIVELKSVEKLLPLHVAQVIT